MADQPEIGQEQLTPPPRAFTQGVGTVFQFAGVILFLASMFVCCGSSLISKDTAVRPDLTQIGWRSGHDRVVYSAQEATSITLIAAIFFGLATAGIGLGLQAQHRRAPLLASVSSACASALWIVQTFFFATVMRSPLLSLLAAGLAFVFVLLLGLAVQSWREMQRNPPPGGHEILPPDYKVPYSHLHEDPPEVRLARELEQRRQRLAIQQKELEMLEEKFRHKMDEQSQ
jgi:hypothetical protein